MDFIRLYGFNTQPPEGGWHERYFLSFRQNSFNTQPPEGGWHPATVAEITEIVSTHSRLKAAG